MQDMKTAVIGAGVIGSSWAALFLAAGHKVAVHDPAEGAEAAVRKYVKRAWPTLRELGVARTEEPGAIDFSGSVEGAVDGAAFVQENVPERLDVKFAAFERIESALAHDALVASSASGLMVSEMQQGWRDPSRFVLGHPFNPPHLIPLVELLGNDRTDPETLRSVERFYEGCDKVTIRVEREVPGHIANRLQAALWREAIDLVARGVGTAEDVDKAMWAGPGLRWGAMGPHMLFHLGAGSAGLGEFCRRYADSFQRWWDSMRDVRLDDKTIENLRASVEVEQGSRSLEQLAAERDDLIVAMRRATKPLRDA